MIATLLLLLSTEPLITFECAGRPLKEVFAKLEPTVGHKIFVSAELAEQPVVILAKNRPWSEVQKDLAWAFRASWKDETLARTEADKRAIADEILVERERQLTEYLAQVKRKTENWGPFTDEDLRELVRGDFETDRQTTRSITEQAFSQIALKMGAKGLARLQPGSYFMYPSLPGEKPFPTDCLPIVRQALENQRRLIQFYPGAEDTKPAQFALFVLPNQYRVVLSGESGRVGTSYYAQEAWKLPEHEPRGDGKPLSLSPRSLELIALAKSARDPNPVTPSAELTDAIVHPMKVDPVELITGDLMLALARSQGKALVASASMLAPYRLLNIKLPITDRMAFELLPSDRSETPSSLLFRLPAEIGLLDKRSTLESYSKGLIGANDSAQLAEALLDACDLGSMSFGEFLMSQRCLNATLMTRPAPLGYKQFYRAIRDGGESVVRLTPDMKKAVEITLRKNPGALYLEVDQMGNRNAEPRKPTSMIQGIQSYDDFQALPARAFPKGIPNEAELRFIPADGMVSDLDRAYFISATADRKSAKECTTYSYGKWLRDVRTGARKDVPTSFWTTGQAGGRIIIRFPGGYFMSLECQAEAIHPAEKPRPVSELPKDFVTEAETISKQDPGRGSPPPAP